MKRKNGVLTLQGVGVFQGSMGQLNIDDVKCIRDALVKVYLPIIEADPDLKQEYNTAVRSLRSIHERQVGERMERERELAAVGLGPLHSAAAAAAAAAAVNPFGAALGQFAAGFLNAAAALLQQQQ
jgi:hypothetical protein